MTGADSLMHYCRPGTGVNSAISRTSEWAPEGWQTGKRGRGRRAGSRACRRGASGVHAWGGRVRG
eukprot:13734043-Alexandrium_andersonii.AAC.1